MVGDYYMEFRDFPYKNGFENLLEDLFSRNLIEIYFSNDFILSKFH